jgi:hypothetical protein
MKPFTRPVISASDEEARATLERYVVAALPAVLALMAEDARLVTPRFPIQCAVVAQRCYDLAAALMSERAKRDDYGDPLDDDAELETAR